MANLFPNPSFEQDLPLIWKPYTGSTMDISRVSGVSRNGTHSLKVTSTTGSIDFTNEGNLIPVAENTDYTASFRAKAATTARTLRVEFKFYSSAGTALGNSFTTGGDLTTQWNRYGRYDTAFTTPPGAAGVYMNIWLINTGSLAVGETIYLDDFALQPAGEPDPFPTDSGTGTTPTPQPVDAVPAPTSSSIVWESFAGTTIPARFTAAGNVLVGSAPPGPGTISTVDGRTGTAPQTYLQVGNAQHNALDTATMTVNIGSGGGTVEFWAQRQSESGWDFNRFYVDGLQQYNVSGSQAWQKISVQLASGAHTLKWEYASDSSVATGFGGQRITAMTVTNVVEASTTKNFVGWGVPF